jgi:3-hydroxyacyl-CoA dehydrogenase
MTGEAYAVRDGVAVVTLDNPPVNSLGHALRVSIVAAVDRANADAAVDAIALCGKGRTFSAGADIREFNTPKSLAEPTLRTVIAAVENSAKPVVAAIGGTAMGGGLELALGCHFRVATASASIALPEVKLGLLPGSGGTQRLPRLVDMDTAIRMIVTGATLTAAELAPQKLFDEVVAGDALAAAVALARRAVDEALPRPRVRDLAIASQDAQARLARAREPLVGDADHYPAPLLCVDAMAAALDKPFEEGLATERALFERLMQSPTSRALRHAFFAERTASHVDGLAEDTRPGEVARVAIVGAGTMGTGIALAFLSAGIPVVLHEISQPALDKGLAAVRANLDGAVGKGRLAREEADRRLAALHPTLAYDDLASADLIVEAVFEDMALKRQVFEALDAVAAPGAILATNTSTLDVDRLAAATRRPQDVAGMHFFSPANVMKLVEVVRGAATAPHVLATLMRVAHRLGKIAVVARVCDGFIGNRMIEHYLRQAMFLLDEGASPAQVDGALERFGMAMGPFRMSDLTGLDVGWRIRQRRYVERPHMPYSRIADRLCERGRLGQKTGSGWYRYEGGRREALHDPATDALIADYRREIGATPRAIPDDEIVDRCILALVNEGARILEDGIAQRASDIDVVYVTGYGFPRFRGGPMYYADQRGLPDVEARMRSLARAPGADAAFWTPAPLLSQLAAANDTFNRMRR